MEEKIFDISINKLCRICFKPGDYQLQTYEFPNLLNNDNITLKSILEEFSTIETHQIDDLPSMLCISCTSDLLKSYLFLKKLKKADEQLQQLLKKNLENKKGIKEIIIDADENLNKSLSIFVEDLEDDNSEINQESLLKLNECICNSLSHFEKNEDDDNIDKKMNINNEYMEVENDDGNCDDYYDGNNKIDVSSYVIEYINEENLNIIEQKKGTKRKINNSKTPHIVVTDNVSNILSKISKKSYKNAIESSLKLKHLKYSRKNLQKPCSSRDSTSSSSPSTTNIKEVNEKDCFVITKFVLTNDEIKNNSTTDNQCQDNNYKIYSNDNDNDSSDNNNPSSSSSVSSLLRKTSASINQIRMFDMKPVEVNAEFGIDHLNQNDDTNVENLNTMYKCKYCPRAYSTSHYLIKHARKCHCCQFCMKGFEKTEDLYKHTREEHNQFSCKLCKKNFSSNSNLRQHMKKIHNIMLPAHTSILSFNKSEFKRNSNESQNI